MTLQGISNYIRGGAVQAAVIAKNHATATMRAVDNYARRLSGFDWLFVFAVAISPQWFKYTQCKFYSRCIQIEDTVFLHLIAGLLAAGYAIQFAHQNARFAMIVPQLLNNPEPRAGG